VRRFYRDVVARERLEAPPGSDVDLCIGRDRIFASQRNRRR